MAAGDVDVDDTGFGRRGTGKGEAAGCRHRAAGIVVGHHPQFADIGIAGEIALAHRGELGALAEQGHRASHAAHQLRIGGLLRDRGLADQQRELRRQAGIVDRDVHLHAGATQIFGNVRKGDFGHEDFS
jgi:hypothetical protein